MIGAAIRKDVRLVLRDRGALVSLFVLPVIFMTVFGAIFGASDERDRPRAIAVWSAGDARGVAVASAIADTPGLTALPLASATDVRAAVAHARVSAGVVVSATGPVEIVIDRAGPPQIRGPLEGALAGAITRAVSSAPPVPIAIVSPPGIAAPLADISSFQVAVPGNAVLFGFFISLTVAMTFATERRTGTWRRLLAAPVSRRRALLATLVPYFVVGVCQLGCLFGIGVGVFGMKIAGSVAALVVLSLAVVACAVSLGLLMAAIGGSEKQLGGIGAVVLLVMGLLGGAMVPRSVMPDAMQPIGLAVPHAWALDGYHAILVREGTTLLEVAPSILALLVFGAAFAGLGVLIFRFERV